MLVRHRYTSKRNYNGASMRSHRRRVKETNLHRNKRRVRTQAVNERRINSSFGFIVGALFLSVNFLVIWLVPASFDNNGYTAPFWLKMCIATGMLLIMLTVTYIGLYFIRRAILISVG